ncbi:MULTISPECIES: phosphotransferase [unclassified Bacillus (in: firmicutes)]|uniref:phosphotransferase n=1 Tax=unclassified Bacillus (in: firmicutes) TaxID=185979 RepID=UPI00273D9A35|nr:MULTISPECIES: phosphotransferase [unclassified Bacillus (in: firmicutes)]MDT0160829.1 phosphotransferase [Bacillus sp. AG4(2022)]
MQNQLWNGEVSIAPLEARELLLSQFPELAPAEVEHFGEGFDNRVFLVNDEYVFRFPRKAAAEELLKTESRILPELRIAAGVDYPVPVFSGKPDKGYPWFFSGYRKISGSAPAGPGGTKSAIRLAEFLKQHHSFPVKRAKELGVPFDTYNRLDMETRLVKMEEYAEKGKAAGILKEEESLFSYIKKAIPIKVECDPVLVHGDLHIRNILADPEGEISGIIDWGDVHLGNPSIDLSIAYSYLRPDAREEFFGAYGEPGPEARDLARFKGIYTALLLAVYAHDRGDAVLVGAASDSLALALAD